MWIKQRKAQRILDDMVAKEILEKTEEAFSNTKVSQKGQDILRAVLEP